MTSGVGPDSSAIATSSSVGYDIVVIGAGILGLATARELLNRRPGLRLLVVDKEMTLAAHQTGHNSGVLHAGLYYQPGSLKARLCLAGKAALERYAQEHGIAVERCGKLVIASESTEIPALNELHRRGEANGIPDLEMLGPEGLKDREPHAVGHAALWSPSTSIYKLPIRCRLYGSRHSHRRSRSPLGGGGHGHLNPPAAARRDCGRIYRALPACDRLRRSSSRPIGTDDRLRAR